MLTRLVSGGQTGVDQAALRAARDAGIAIGGWCPPGRVCDAGIIPPDLPLREPPRERSDDAPDVPRSLRTEWNVRDADATLVLRPAVPVAGDAGTAWTVRCAARFGKPSLVCDPAAPEAADRIVAWLRRIAPRTLNVAGPSERSAPGIGAAAGRVLRRVLAALARG